MLEDMLVPVWMHPWVVLLAGAVLAGGCGGACRERYLARFKQTRADELPRGEIRDAQALGAGAIAVGDAGMIVEFGPDGLMEVDSGVDVDLHALILTPGLLAVGDAGTILASGDGVTWRAVDAGTDADLHGASKSWTSNDVVVVGEDVVLFSSDGGERWVELTGEAPAGALRSVVYVDPGFLAFSADGDVMAVDQDAGTFAPLGTKVGAAVRNVMFDAVGDAWFVLVDGTTWIGFREGDAWNFDPGGSFHGCDSDGFRELGDYILCDDGHARERFSLVDEPGAPLEHYSPARAATASGDSIIVFGEDGFARLYAADHDSRRSDDCGHWPG
jgi:hypothetical protein